MLSLMPILLSYILDFVGHVSRPSFIDVGGRNSGRQFIRSDALGGKPEGKKG